MVGKSASNEAIIFHSLVKGAQLTDYFKITVAGRACSAEAGLCRRAVLLTFCGANLRAAAAFILTYNRLFDGWSYVYKLRRLVCK